MFARARHHQHDVASGTGSNQRRQRGEGGYSLVELLIYSSLLVIILTIVGGMLLNTLTSKAKVLESADANAVSQLISTSVHSGVRNATALQVTDSANPDIDDQLFVITAVSSDPAALATARVCQAWFYTESNGGAMFYRRAAPPQTFVAPTPDALANDMTGWTLMGSGLSAAFAQPVFNPDVTPDHRAVTVNFTINAGGDSSPALMSTKVTSRQGAAPSTEPTCF
ncbi:hypothetical protein [Cryobacterium sp. Y29]|uniref:hypothetical protein n=1 Tax=Cryobacterium sp. Y29 TaxID=2048285 RepID=UPI000CE4A6E5|nr:hypothetical protein [Cryobacterium sp. Y29]